MHLEGERMAHDLELAGRSASTTRIYVAAIREFCDFGRRSPTEMDQEDVRAWIRVLKRRGLSAQRLRHHFSALKFFYARTLGRPNVVSFLSSPKDRSRAPVVLAAGEVARLLRALNEPKYRVFFALVYATGLRLSEACRLETRDIDAARASFMCGMARVARNVRSC